MPRARINGINLYYEDGGIGAPVVFIHGGFPSLAMKLQDVDEWAWTWERDFAARFHFIWYDRRGCYRSDSPADGYALENQARDLAALLDHLQLDSAHVIGSSAGGPIAIVFAALWPHRVRSLILAGTGLEFFPEEGDPISDIIRRQIELLDEAGVEVAFDARPPRVQTSFESLWRAEEEAARGRLDTYVQHEQIRTAQAQQVPRSDRVHFYAVELRSLQAYMDRNIRADARQVLAPTLVLHGSDDREVPLALGKEIAQTIPGVFLQVVPGGGHSLVHRTAEGRQRAIQFIAEQESICQTAV